MERQQTCTDCRTVFTYEHRAGPVRQWCDKCRALHKKQRDAAKSQRWREANVDYQAEYMRRYHQQHKDDPEYRRQRREAFNLYKYGITQAGLAGRIEKQGGQCAICGGPPNGPGKRLHIDHCHETGRIRGLLCSKCNTLIGLADNDPCRLRDAADYLKE